MSLIFKYKSYRMFYILGFASSLWFIANSLPPPSFLYMEQKPQASLDSDESFPGRDAPQEWCMPKEGHNVAMLRSSKFRCSVSIHYVLTNISADFSLIVTKANTSTYVSHLLVGSWEKKWPENGNPRKTDSHNPTTSRYFPEDIWGRKCVEKMKIFPLGGL